MIIKQRMHSILLARQYNNATGASVTHIDIDQWGFMEAQEIEYAIEFIDGMR